MICGSISLKWPKGQDTMVQFEVDTKDLWALTEAEFADRYVVPALCAAMNGLKADAGPLPASRHPDGWRIGGLPDGETFVVKSLEEFLSGPPTTRTVPAPLRRRQKHDATS